MLSNEAPKDNSSKQKLHLGLKEAVLAFMAATAPPLAAQEPLGVERVRTVEESIPQSTRRLFEKYGLQFQERLADPAFQQVISNLTRAGVLYYPDELLTLRTETYRNPTFLKNAALLGRYQDVSNVPLKDILHTLVLEELGEYLEASPSPLRRAALRFANEVSVDVNAWKNTLGLVRKHKNNSAALQVLYAMDAKRLAHPEYVVMLKDYLQKQSPEDAQFLFGATGATEVDLLFLSQKTGIFGAEELALRLATNSKDLQLEPLTIHLLQPFKSALFMQRVTRMNELHDEGSSTRLSVVKDLNARALFETLLVGGKDAYPSTFRLLYDGDKNNRGRQKLPEEMYSFVPKTLKEYRSLYAFFTTIRPTSEQFGSFLEQLAQNNLLERFMQSLGGAKEQGEILKQYLFDPRTGLSQHQAVLLDSILQTKYEPVRDVVFATLSQAIEDPRTNMSTKQNAELLVAYQFVVAGSKVPPWAQGAVEKYGNRFAPVERFDEREAFRTGENNISFNIQQHFFYDDRHEKIWDGHNSFRHFLESLGWNVSWSTNGIIESITRGPKAKAEIEDKGDYVVIRKRNQRTNRTIVIYANKPDRSDEDVARVHAELMERERPQIVVHRGHTPHASKTIRLLKPWVRLVSLGSCGGVKETFDVLEKAPGAQILGTGKVGTMLVNDTGLRTIDEALLEKGEVEWVSVQKFLDQIFARGGGLTQEWWQSYVLPHRNRAARFVAAGKKRGGV